MKTLLLNTNDIQGGAARAAYRLHKGLQAAGVDSSMLVQDKSSDDRTVIGSQTKLEKGWRKIRPTLDALPLRFYSHRDRVPYSLASLPSNLNSKIKAIAPDIINLHWICGGYIPVEEIAKFNKPIVWTLHDMWAFTGGCHYSQECDRYTQFCGKCPQLNSNRGWDLSRWTWQRKAKNWKNINLTIVTPSNWLAKCASASSLFQNLPIKVIPNGIDINKYKPIAKSLARELLNLIKDKQLVLFGAMNAASDQRKGFQLLQPALQYLNQSGWQDKLEIVIFGASEPINPPNLGFKCHYMGRLNDDISLMLAYSAADVMVMPSIQDNLPNTVIEALSCGTPCVAFNIGGMADMIDHKQNGYLAHSFEVDDLARGIAWIIEDELRWQSLSGRAREKVEQEFILERQAKTYLKLFEEILVNQNARKFHK